MKFIAGVCAALAISAVGIVAVTFAEASAFGRPSADKTVTMQAPATPQAPPTPQAPATPQAGTEKVTPQKQAMAKNLTEEITAMGASVPGSRRRKTPQRLTTTISLEWLEFSC